MIFARNSVEHFGQWLKRWLSPRRLDGKEARTLVTLQ